MSESYERVRQYLYMVMCSLMSQQKENFGRNKGGQRGGAGEQASCFKMGLMCQHNKKINLCKFSMDGLPHITCCCSTPFFFFLCRTNCIFSFLCHTSYHGRSQDKPSLPHQLALGQTREKAMCAWKSPPLSGCMQDTSLAYQATLLRPFIPSWDHNLPWITQPELALQKPGRCAC